jgi:hypothetical protein
MAKQALADTDETAHVEKVIVSATLERSPKLRDLLRYLWENRASEISEYAIATRALGRPASFDTQTDASTRVTIARLRQKLDDYYAEEGQADERRILLPAGSYRLQVVGHEPVSSTAMETLRQGARKWRARFWVLAAVSAASLILCAFLLLSGHPNGRETAAARPPLPRFWQSFLANGKPVVIALPTPVFHWFSKARVVVRDPVINDYDSSSTSATLTSLRDRWGDPVLLQNFAVLPDVEAGLHLQSFLQSRGVSAAVLSTGDVTPSIMENSNVVMLGIPGTSKRLDAIMANLNFAMKAGIGNVDSKNPALGEPATFPPVMQSSERQILPGIIAMAPDATTGSNVLVLAGRATKSAALMLTISHELSSLEEFRTRAGAYGQFEVVFKTELDGRNVLRSWPVACRPLRSNGTQRR